MIDGIVAYDGQAASDAVIAVAGGPAAALSRTPQLVEFSFQLEALALARDMRQPENLVRMFQETALAALRALES